MVEMVIKLRTMIDEQPVVHQLVESVHQMGLAGVGVVALLQRQGEQVFRSLVAKGEEVQPKVQACIHQQQATMRQQLQQAQAFITAQWDKVEQTCETQAVALIRRLGIPTREDIEELTKSVEDLNDSIKDLARHTS